MVLFSPRQSLCVSSQQNVVLETCTVLGSTTEEVLSILEGVYMSVDRFCHCNSIAIVLDVVMKLEIKMKADFEDK